MTASRDQRDASGKTVLIVEDDLTIRTVLEAVLADAGYRSQSCHITSADIRIATLQPGLVILGVRPYDRAGWAVLARVKCDPRTATIPILICATAEALMTDPSGLIDGWDCPVVEIPFDLNELTGAVQALLADPWPPPLGTSPRVPRPERVYFVPRGDVLA